jgi:hypothetical protein
MPFHRDRFLHKSYLAESVAVCSILGSFDHTILNELILQTTFQMMVAKKKL